MEVCMTFLKAMHICICESIGICICICARIYAVQKASWYPSGGFYIDSCYKRYARVTCTHHTWYDSWHVAISISLVLQCVAVCCSVLQCVLHWDTWYDLWHIAISTSLVLQCVAVYIVACVAVRHMIWLVTYCYINKSCHAARKPSWYPLGGFYIDSWYIRVNLWVTCTSHT